MIQNSSEAENAALLAIAQKMCVAARTAPKTKGDDYISACIVTGEEKENLALEMERLSDEFNYGFFKRDAGNLRNSFAVVLIGVKNHYRALNEGCGYCNFKNCAECAKHGGMCAYGPIDLGIAIGSAVSTATDARVDNRVMFSAGRAALSLEILGKGIQDVIGIPISALGKSPYFDRSSGKPVKSEKK